MFQALIPLVKASIKARIGAVVQSVVWGLIAAIVAAVAVGFFCAAGFIALLPVVGPINTCLVFGGVFLIAALVALILVAGTRHRAAHAQASLAQAVRDPQTLALGAEVVRLLGGRRIASAGLIGAFVVGVLLSRRASRR